jgi:hypothetical protein
VEHLPSFLISLTFSGLFLQRVHLLPSSLTHLTFRNAVNLINFYLTNLSHSLTHIKFGWRFNNNSVKSLPPCVTHLTLNCHLQCQPVVVGTTAIEVGYKIKAKEVAIKAKDVANKQTMVQGTWCFCGRCTSSCVLKITSKLFYN